jgi:hypothetical protein
VCVYFARVCVGLVYWYVNYSYRISKVRGKSQNDSSCLHIPYRLIMEALRLQERKIRPTST